MNHYPISFGGHHLHAMPDGTLYWPKEGILVVSDMHLAKSERVARRGGAILPPYETQDTLARLDRAIETLNPALVLSLGDSFDDNVAAQALDDAEQMWITRLQAGRNWIWITGNHDPAPVPLPGMQLGETCISGITFRHIAEVGARHEISGHYHPKGRISARGQSISRPCFLADSDRIIMPAFGTYTGGLRTNHAALQGIVDQDALCILTGPTKCHAIPFAAAA